MSGEKSSSMNKVGQAADKGAEVARGMGEAEMARIAELMDRVLVAPDDEAALAGVREDVRALTARFPLYPAGGVAAAH